MVEPLDYKNILRKLIEKTREGRVEWQKEGSFFSCELNKQYEFRVWKNEDEYVLRMSDIDRGAAFGSPIGPNPILLEIYGEEEIYYSDPEKKEKFEMISDLYELARRKALNIPSKLSKLEELLDRI